MGTIDGTTGVCEKRAVPEGMRTRAKLEGLKGPISRRETIVLSQWSQKSTSGHAITCHHHELHLDLHAQFALLPYTVTCGVHSQWCNVHADVDSLREVTASGKPGPCRPTKAELVKQQQLLECPREG